MGSPWEISSRLPLNNDNKRSGLAPHRADISSESTLAGRSATSRDCARAERALPSASSFAASFRFSFPPSLPRAGKEVINIATAFVPGHRKGQNFARGWAGSRLIPRVKMEVSGDPPLPSGGRGGGGGEGGASSGLGRTEGGSRGRYFRSRVTYYRTGRTLCEFR